MAQQLRPGLPPNLRFVYLSGLPVSARIVHSIIEHAFPMVRVIRAGSLFWTVLRKESAGLSSLLLSESSTVSDRNSVQSMPTHHHIPNHAHGGHLYALTLAHLPSSNHTFESSSNQTSILGQTGLAHAQSPLFPPTSSQSSVPPIGPKQVGGGMLELEPWPMRRIVYHATEWLEWLGCEEAAVAGFGITREAEAEGVGVGIFG